MRDDGGNVVPTCPYSSIVAICLRELGVEFTSHPIDLLDKPSWFVEQTAGTTPALCVDGRWDGDSGSILKMLMWGEVSCGRLMPPSLADVNQEAAERLRREPSGGSIGDALFGAVIQYAIAEEGEEGSLATKKAALREAMRALSSHLRSDRKQYVGGSTVCKDDAVCATALLLVGVVAEYDFYGDIGLPEEDSIVRACGA